jgi:hypothetical protein
MHVPIALQGAVEWLRFSALSAASSAGRSSHQSVRVASHMGCITSHCTGYKAASSSTVRMGLTNGKRSVGGHQKHVPMR